MPSEGHDSIFGEAPSDDLFNVHAGNPPATMPERPAPRSYNDTILTDSQAPRPLPSSPANDSPTMDLEQFSQPGHQPWPEPRAKKEASTQEISEPLPEEEPEEEAPREARRPAARASGGGGGIFVWMLLLYGLVASGIAAYFFYEKTQQEAQSSTVDTGRATLLGDSRLLRSII